MNKILIATRRITKTECPWLDRPIAKGTVMYRYSGCTYGCIQPSGIAVTMVEEQTPFFEVPADAVEAPAVYRSMTAEEAKLLSYGDHPSCRLNDGRIGTVKVNGQPKTWKRDSQRVEVPVKYGMYEYATVCAQSDGTMDRLVVRV